MLRCIRSPLISEGYSLGPLHSTYINHAEVGFQAGKKYEVVYQAQNPPVAGLGLASIRDMASAMKYDPDIVAPGRYAYMYGSSQTGRLIRQIIHEGFTIDEQGRKVFDAAFVKTGGTSEGSFNQRFARPNHVGNFTETEFPIQYQMTIDPVTGREGGLGEAHSRRPRTQDLPVRHLVGVLGPGPRGRTAAHLDRWNAR